MSLPILETRRLRLRPRAPSDLEECLRMDREPGTLQWVAWPGGAGGWQDEAAHRAFVQGRMTTRYPDGMGYWTVERRDAAGGFLGWVLLIPEDARGEEVEIGWRLTGAARGQGIATEAAAAVLAHGLATLGLARVIADIHPANRASRRVAEKIGMEVSGRPPVVPPLLRYVARELGPGLPGPDSIAATGGWASGRG